MSDRKFYVKLKQFYGLSQVHKRILPTYEFYYFELLMVELDYNRVRIPPQSSQSECTLLLTALTDELRFFIATSYNVAPQNAENFYFIYASGIHFNPVNKRAVHDWCEFFLSH